MENKTANLFVYGTLLDKGNEFGAYLHQHGSIYSKGRLEGLLYNIGNYPGALHKPGCGEFVHGTIFKLAYADVEEVLKELDDYEGIGDEQPQPNEYVRELVEIESENGVLECWVYLYNWPVDGLVRIAGGDYLAR